MESVEQTIRMNNLSKELKRYGFAQSSQDAISQAGQIYGVKQEAELQSGQLSKAQVEDMINKMQRIWIFKENTDQKIGVLADQLVKVTDKLNELIKSISLIEMNQAVFDKKLNALRDRASEPAESRNEIPRQRQEHMESSPLREKEVERVLDKPIDRNGVAPADVSVMKMFYCGNK